MKSERGIRPGRSRGYCSDVVRTLDLRNWAGRWVALDADDEVVRDAETLGELMAIAKAEWLIEVTMMRAPVPGEPVLWGSGCWI